MNNQRLSRRNLFFIGTMLFGMFFGAGNLIFPVYLGQASGRNIIWAVLGFLVSGVGLPLLAVAAIGIRNAGGVYGMASKLGRRFALIFTVILYLGIGPLFATPRLATISYEIGLRPFILDKYEPLALGIFSFLFFAVAWFFARKPGKIMMIIGKVLTPAFLVSLVLLLLFVVLFPLGGVHGAPIGAYKTAALGTGFTDGYMTMDALAGLAFGVVIVSAIQELGVTDARHIATDTMRAGAIAAALMAVLYAVLAYMGLTSLGQFDRASNGGIIIAQIARYYFGTIGSFLTAIIVILACLKTGVGLITAFGDMFKELFPKMNYQVLILFAAGVPFLLANVGLDQILMISKPFLFFLYPLAIVLILLTLANQLFRDDARVYQITMAVTAIPAILDGLNALPAAWQVGPIQTLLRWANFLPGFSQGLGWTVPALVAFIVALVIVTKRPRPEE